MFITNHLYLGCTFSEVVGVHTPGGLAQQFDSLDECKTACIDAKSTTCTYGFDYNPTAAAGSKCWFSTVTTTAAHADVSHFNISCIQTGMSLNIDCEKLVVKQIFLKAIN